MITMFALLAVEAQPQQTPPLKLVQTVRLPNTEGNFNHFGIDVKGKRLFATLEKLKSLEIFDLRTLKQIYTISGIGEPYAVLYREDLDRIYVTDDVGEALRIYDGKTYALIKSIKLLPDTESFAYAASKYLYINNG